MLLVEYVANLQGKSQSDIAKETRINRVIVNKLIRGWEKPYPKWRNAIAAALDWPQDRAAELFEEITDVRTESGWLKGDA